MTIKVVPVKHYQVSSSLDPDPVAITENCLGFIVKKLECAIEFSSLHRQWEEVWVDGEYYVSCKFIIRLPGDEPSPFYPHFIFLDYEDNVLCDFSLSPEEVSDFIEVTTKLLESN